MRQALTTIPVISDIPPLPASPAPRLERAPYKRPVRNRSLAQERFLILLSKGLTVAGAAKGSGASRRIVYGWRSADPAFAQAWDYALEDGCDHLEDIILSHAHKDWRAAVALLRARNPQKWGNRVTVTQPVTASGTRSFDQVLDGLERTRGSIVEIVMVDPVTGLEAQAPTGYNTPAKRPSDS